MIARCALPLVAAALASCSAGPATRLLAREAGPTAEVQAITARAFDRSHADFELALEVTNPGTGLSVRSAQYELLLDGRPFAAGVIALQAEVPARGRAPLKVGLALAYLDVPFAARAKVKRGEPLQVVARGVLRAQGTDIAFAGEASLVALAEGGQDR